MEAGRKVGFFNQLWISHYPKSQKDAFSVLATFTGESIGVFQDSSEFSGNFDMFKILNGDPSHPSILMLQTDSKFEFLTKITPVTGEFEFKLELGGPAPRGPQIYFTLAEWEIGNQEDLTKVMVDILNKKQ